MLRLRINRDPEWIDLGYGVEVLCEPMTTAVHMAATTDAEFAAMPEGTDRLVLLVALNKAIARRVITDWRGVGDEDGNQIAPSPAAISALMDLKQMHDAFNERFVFRWHMVVAEKNVSAPSPNGTSAEGGNTAQAAAAPAASAPGS